MHDISIGAVILQTSSTDKLISLGVTFYKHTAQKEEIVHVPAGFLVMERGSGSQGPLICGVRKSMFFSTGRDGYQATLELLKSSGTNVDKMDQILNTFPA